MDGFGEDIQRLVAFMPDWAASILILVVSLAIGLAVHRVVFRLLSRAVEGRDLFWRSLVARTRRPLRLAIIIVLLRFGTAVAPLPPAWSAAIAHAMGIAFIILFAWSLHTAMHIWSTVYLRRYKLDAEDNLLARKHVTQSRILMRVATVLLVLVATAAVLMTFDPVRQYGVSLLASAGAAGLILGLALQPVLKNLFAGIQLAMTQPIRIDDALIVEGEWGQVEEITATYVVIKVWDWRRLIVPLSYFIEQPFQNWTRETASLIGVVTLYLDHSADIGRIRAWGNEIVGATPLWDGRVYACQVTDFRERVMEVRLLASARNAPRTFDLRCELREKLIDRIQRRMPGALPRTRGVLTLDPDHGPLPPQVAVVPGQGA